MPELIRPRANEPVTLLLQIGSVPVSEVTRAGAVDLHGMMVPRTPAARGLDVIAGTPATVLFIREGRLYRWPMLVEEVLPSTWLLSSTREPGEGGAAGVRPRRRRDASATPRASGGRVAPSVGARGLVGVGVSRRRAFAAVGVRPFGRRAAFDRRRRHCLGDGASSALDRVE